LRKSVGLPKVRGPMIPLNSWQRLPPKAIWYGLLSSLVLAMVLVAVGGIFQASGRSGLMSGFLYLFAIFLVGRSVVYYQTYAFLLTDKALTTVAGYLNKRSCTFRLDRIQDIDTFSGPLHTLLGLKAVTIWTASPDQFGGKRRSPDGRIVLDAASADWLRDYLANPPAVPSSPSEAAQPQALSQTPPRAKVGLVFAVCAIAALGIPVVLSWNHVTITRPGTAMTPQTAAAPAAPAAADIAPQSAKHHAVRTPPPAQAVQVPPDYAVACAIHDSGSIDGVIPCAKFGEAKRCLRETDFASKPTPPPAMLTVVNRSNEDVRFYWLDPTGARALYASLPPSGHVTQQSHVGAHWLVSTRDDRCVAIFDAATMTIGIY
jgi:membrane protein YdbS with pleckstrin-like domain